jgi:hypothetical protein
MAILTNPCSEIHLEDWFPEDRIDGDNMSVDEEKVSEYMEKFLSLVEDNINVVVPGHRDMSVEELNVWFSLFCNFTDFSLYKDANLIMGVIITIRHKSGPVSLNTLLYCIKVCRSIYIECPGSMDQKYGEFSKHVHLILGDLIPSRNAPNAV